MVSQPPPNFHVSYEKLKKIAEELRGGGDKDPEYWAWRNEASSGTDSEEEEFGSWLANARSKKNIQNTRHPRKRKQEEISEAKGSERYLWDPGEWPTSSSRAHYNYAKASGTARGGGVLKLPKSPCVTQYTVVGTQDFIYSSEEGDSDGDFSEAYPTASSPQHNTASAVLNVSGIQRKIEKCSAEAVQCSSTYCKESCNKFLGESIRKQGSLEVLFGSFEEHHNEIIHLRQELACTLSCALMYDLDICQVKQADTILWKYVFYLLIQYYRNNITSATSDSVRSTLNTQLEGHIVESIQFYSMILLQIQKRFKVNYKSSGTQSRTQVLALLLLHNTLLWIGDLYRYLSQTRDTGEWGQARNYYLLAQTLAPRNPRPYHQLALLGKYAHRRLHAVYYFTLSLFVRNPFAQSKELLLSVLAELRKKALVLGKRDSERGNNLVPGSKEVYNNKVVDWIFVSAGDQALNISEQDMRKRFVVYLLSGLGGLLSNIDLDRVDVEFLQFKKFYLHHLKLSGFIHHEVYQQLLLVLLYTTNTTKYKDKLITILECFLSPCLDTKPIVKDGEYWLCELHSPLSLMMVFAQSQVLDPVLIRQFSVTFWRPLTDWLNCLEAAIAKYIKYTDFTEECVVLKEITLLRGVEMLSSLQTITKPFYLNNLTREQSEDLGRAVLVINTFEKLSEHLPFLHCSDSRLFTFHGEDCAANDKQTTEQTDVGTGHKQQEDTTDSDSDIEILAVRNLKIDEGVDGELLELKNKKELLLKQLHQKEEKESAVSDAVKEIVGMRISITIKPKYIIPDTNCFLTDIDKLRRVLVSSYKILVPLVVLREIRGLCNNKEKGERAKLATQVLHQHLTTILLLTSQGSILDSKHAVFEEERSKMCNDDVILNSVLKLSEDTGHKETINGTLHLTQCVVLLTDDSNLRVKAHSRNLAVSSLTDFILSARI